MNELFWKIEHFLIIALRRPRVYIIPLSIICSGIFSSLKIFEPIKRFIDNLPFITGSEWLYYVLFAIFFFILFNLISLVVGSIFGVQPFEFIANYVDKRKITPNLTSYVDNRLSKSVENLPKFDYRVRIIEKKELDEFNLLNREIFSFTAFGLPLNKIRKRNNNLFNVNKCAFAFIEVNIDGFFIPIGISHILPLNDLGKTLYIKNHGIKDSEIEPEHIAKDGEWSNAIILFSMGLLPTFRNRLKDRSLTIAYVFADHLVQLLLEIQRKVSKKQDTYLFAQTEKPYGGLGRLLAHLGFERTDIISGDGYALWKYKLDLSSTNQKADSQNGLTVISVRDFLDELLTSL